MPRYSKLNPLDFQHMAWDAGIIVDEEDFDPSTGEINVENIRWATTGTNSFSASRDLQDMGADVNNAPEGTMQLQKAKPWVVTLSGTAVSVTIEDILEFLGGGSIDGANQNKIIPSDVLLADDFKGKWLICNYSEYNGETKGGCLAIHLMNTMSTNGFKVNLDREANGKFPYELRCYYDINDISKPPFEIVLINGEPEPETKAET